MAWYLLCLVALVDAGLDHTIHLISSGKQRKAILHVPAIPLAPASIPLVANLHTLAENAKMEEDLTGMSALADKEDFAVVYPDGLLDGNSEPWLPLGVGKSWNGGMCCPKACAVEDPVKDVVFMQDLVSYLTQTDIVQNLTDGKLKIDPLRVYAAGASNGAFMVNRIGCQAPDLFAAIAPLSGPIANGQIAPW